MLFEGELGDIDRNLATKYHAPPAGYNGLKGLFQQAQAARATHSLGGLAAWVEPGQVARFMALEVALGHEDGYTIHANNFMMYHSPRSHCFFLLPHGLDNLNYNLAGGAYPPMLGQLATALLAAPEGRDLYRKALRRVLAQDMDLDQLQIDLAVLTRQLQPVLQQSEPLWAERQLQGAVALVSGLWRRRAALLEDLNHE